MTPGADPEGDAKLWTLFRRLLLGTVVEVLRDAAVRFDSHAIRLAFDPESLFHYPALHSHMRFKGRVHADLATPITPDVAMLVERALHQVWPELVSVIQMPVFGTLSVSTNELLLRFDGSHLCIRFDLAAA